MSYELSLPLKRGSIEIEFEDVEDLEKQLAALDVARIERAVAGAFRRRTTSGGRTAKKGATTKRPAAKRSAKKRRA